VMVTVCPSLMRRATSGSNISLGMLFFIGCSVHHS
jgi:hypothetical protein